MAAVDNNDYGAADDYDMSGGGDLEEEETSAQRQREDIDAEDDLETIECLGQLNLQEQRDSLLVAELFNDNDELLLKQNEYIQTFDITENFVYPFVHILVSI